MANTHIPRTPKNTTPSITPARPKQTRTIHKSNPKMYPIMHRIMVSTIIKNILRVNNINIRDIIKKYTEQMRKKLKYPLSFFKKLSRYSLIKLSQEISEI